MSDAPKTTICPICNGPLAVPGSVMCGTRHQTATYYTAVFRVEGDRKKHKEWWLIMHALTKPETGITVVATASFDALAKLDEAEGEITW